MQIFFFLSECERQTGGRQPEAKKSRFIGEPN